MCGLFGAFYFDDNEKIDISLVECSLKELGHRGPDSSNTVIFPGIVLGHTRLSFLDLSEHGGQPFVDVTGRYAIVYNGEIYNFRELRDELRLRGYKFQSNSDTEVLLYSLIEFGESVLSRLEGMFSFVFLDRDARELIIGRDRYGIKPLFYVENAAGIFFASEVKALRGWITLEPNGVTIGGYIAGHYLQTSGQSLVNGVKFFPQGCSGRFKPGEGLQVKPFYEVVDFFDGEYQRELASKSQSELINMCDGLLNESIQKHMISDVPVGALCSGGVDSSLILALATKHTDNLRIFHSNVVGAHSETPAARLLAKHLKLDLEIAECHDDDFVALMPDVIRHCEAPFIYHPNSVPFLQVARLVKEKGIKAVLTGEGADEALLGYANVPLAGAIAGYHSALDKLRAVIHCIPWAGQLLWRSPVSKNNGIGLITGFDSEVPSNWVQRIAKTNFSEREAQEALSLLMYHLRTLLIRNDRMGMAASLEARFPFLDHEFIRFAVNLPRSSKIHFTKQAAGELRHPFFMTKWILREVAKKYLPPELSWRRKRGFPTNAYDRVEISSSYYKGSWVQEYLQLPWGRLEEFLRVAPVENKLRLLMLDVWGRLIIESESIEEVRTRLTSSVKIKKI